MDKYPVRKLKDRQSKYMFVFMLYIHVFIIYNYYILSNLTKRIQCTGVRVSRMTFFSAFENARIAQNLEGDNPSKYHKIKQQLFKQDYAGSRDTGGLTWFGSQFTGPGNKLVDADTKKSNFTELPKTPLDWVTLEHDVDYYNEKTPTINSIWNIDKKAIKNAYGVIDPYYGAEATIVGLGLKNVVERTLESVTGSSTPLYPDAQTSGYHIPWFDVKKNISRRVLGE